MFDVENVPPELLLLMGSKLCVGGETLGAIAANFRIGMLHNPPGSGALLTITEIRCSSTASQRYVWGPTLNVFSTIEPTAFTDLRVFGQGTIGQILSTTSLAIGPTFGHARALAQTDMVVKVPRGIGVLSPGTSFTISNTVVNTDFTYTFSWLERIAQPSELNF